MSTPQVERRFVPRTSGQIRAGANGFKNGIAGTAAVIGSLSEDLGGFVEEIARGAFDGALKRSDIRGLFNHDPNMVLGRAKSGTMRVWADARGLHYEIPDLPKSRADVREAIERGDVDGNSFSFRVAQGGDYFETRNGRRVRVITEFAEILDVGPVAFPAYSETVVAVRTLELARAPSKAPASPSSLTGERQRLDAALRESARDLEWAEREVVMEMYSQVRSEARDRGLSVFARIAHDEGAMRWLDQVVTHEAGHALLYWTSAAGIASVGVRTELDPARIVGGYAACLDEELRSAQACLAGIAAERLAGFPSRPLVGDEDVNRARRLLPHDKRADEDIEREIRKVSDTLRKRWPAVQALADQLKRKVDLSGPEADAIIGAAIRRQSNAAA